MTRLVLKGLVCEISTNIRVKRRGFPGTVRFERERNKNGPKETVVLDLFGFMLGFNKALALLVRSTD